MQFFVDYGLFLAKVFTLTIAILIIFAAITTLIAKSKERPKEKLDVKKVNDKYDEMTETLNAEILNKAEFKKYLKEKKKQAKTAEKSEEKSPKKRIFVIDFDGDVRASEVEPLREEITAILNVATPEDEVLVRLESGGGMVYSYGLAASQLRRIKQVNIPLTVAVDKVAASGGYLMACVADTILCAPFAIVGSIGVVAQIPNFHRLLKKNDIDFEQITAGQYKRTLTVFGENTVQARKKFQEEIEEIHFLFKDFITQNRPIVNIEEVATGEHWLGAKALQLNLIDKLLTSDDYLLAQKETADIYEISYTYKQSLADKISSMVQSTLKKMTSVL